MPSASNKLSGTEALTKSIQVVGPLLWKVGLFFFLVMIGLGITSGLSAVSEQHNSGWESLFFMVFGVQSLITTVPVAIALYVALSLLMGLVVFLYFRFLKKV